MRSLKGGAEQLTRPYSPHFQVVFSTCRPCFAFQGPVFVLVPVTGDKHCIERPDGGFDDIAAVLHWRRQRCSGLVAIVGFIGGERTGADKHRHPAVELVFAA